MKQFIYITFLNNGWQTKWEAIRDSRGFYISDVDAAYKRAQNIYPDCSWGIADYKQMKLGNAMRDNF